MELVTAGGDVVDVDERTPELLWGLARGNFGVVTRLRYRLADVTRVAGGQLNYRGPGVGRVLERIIALEQAPDELTMQVIARRWPDDGSLGLTLLVAWRGDAAGSEGDRDLVADPSRIDGDVRAMSWLQLQTMNPPLPRSGCATTGRAISSGRRPPSLPPQCSTRPRRSAGAA